MAKVAKVVAKKGAKSLKKASKKMKKRAKRAFSSNSARSLYTKTEKKELQKLRNRRSYYKKSLKKLASNQADEGITMTLKDIRGRISEDTAREMYYQGYFDSENAEDYRNRDFREWMTDEGDNDLMSQVIEEFNTLDIEGIDSQPIDPKTKKKNEKIKKYTDELKKIEDDIKKITDKAEKRKVLKKAKALAERAAAETGLSVAEILDKSDKAKSFFTDPEKATIENLKSIIAKEWARAGTVGIDDPDEKQQQKQFIYTNVMQGPLEGFRYALKSKIMDNVVAEYGEEVVPFAGSLVDLATGIVTGKGGSVKGVIAGAFESFILESNANPELMQERSEELVNLGKSTIKNEAAAGLARDVLIDVAKDVIMSGGNLVAALPKVVKDSVFDITKAAIGYNGNVKAMQKEKAKIAAKFTGDTVISKDEFENRYFKQLDE